MGIIFPLFGKAALRLSANGWYGNNFSPIGTDALQLPPKGWDRPISFSFSSLAYLLVRLH
jgi:hypothetical protein